jgi:hypothetical protein
LSERDDDGTRQQNDFMAESKKKRKRDQETSLPLNKKKSKINKGNNDIESSSKDKKTAVKSSKEAQKSKTVEKKNTSEKSEKTGSLVFRNVSKIHMIIELGLQMKSTTFLMIFRKNRKKNPRRQK